MPRVSFPATSIRSHVSDTDGKIYCEFDASNPRRSGSTHLVLVFRSIGSSK